MATSMKSTVIVPGMTCNVSDRVPPHPGDASLPRPRLQYAAYRSGPSEVIGRRPDSPSDANPRDRAVASGERVRTSRLGGRQANGRGNGVRWIVGGGQASKRKPT